MYIYTFTETKEKGVPLYHSALFLQGSISLSLEPLVSSYAGSQQTAASSLTTEIPGMCGDTACFYMGAGITNWYSWLCITQTLFNYQAISLVQELKFRRSFTYIMSVYLPLQNTMLSISTKPEVI